MNHDLNVCIDKNRVQQVLLNIYTNALKFVDKGGVIRIKARLINSMDQLTYPSHFASYFTQSENGLMEINIQDNGIGMDSEEQSRLFKLLPKQFEQQQMKPSLT